MVIMPPQDAVEADAVKGGVITCIIIVFEETTAGEAQSSVLVSSRCMLSPDEGI